MSGTSADAIDAVLVDFSPDFPKLLSCFSLAVPEDIRMSLALLATSSELRFSHLAELDIRMAQLFSGAVNRLLEQSSLEREQIKAIGSHGQTLKHAPEGKFPHTLQIGDPNTIAVQTGLTVVADFRRKDMALGGQGAPLAPAFHQRYYQSDKEDRIILNLGGIANITFLPKSKKEKIVGFDTGPGNALLDAWCHVHQNKPYDASGEWGSGGSCHENLLEDLLADSYFSKPHPKSTGKEYFNLLWLNAHSGLSQMIAQDVQATLHELTAQSIANAIKDLTPSAEILVCGGGALNVFLMERIQKNAGKKFTVKSIDKLGISANWVEATAFAWFAKQRIENVPVDLCGVTGSRAPAVLGGIYPP